MSNRIDQMTEREAKDILNDICHYFNIGGLSRKKSTIITNVRNAIRLSKCLKGIERANKMTWQADEFREIRGIKEPFEREDRYLVFKVSELTSEQIRILTAWNATVKAQRLEKGKDALTVVVVESDWPEYETVWKMIEDRVSTQILGMKDSHLTEMRLLSQENKSIKLECDRLRETLKSIIKNEKFSYDNRPTISRDMADRAL